VLYPHKDRREKRPYCETRLPVFIQ